MVDTILTVAFDLDAPTAALQLEHPITGQRLRPDLVPGSTSSYKVVLPDVLLPSPYPFKLWVMGRLVTKLVPITDLRPPVEPTDPYALAFASATSARVRETSSNRLVRTLWGNEPRPAGPLAFDWDGKDDMGQPVTIDPSLLDFQASYSDSSKAFQWQGLVGASSPQAKTESVPFLVDDPSGNVVPSTVHLGFRPFADIDVFPGDDVARFCTGQTEGPQSTGKFKLTDIQTKISEQLPIPAANRLTLGSCYVKQDASLAWYLSYDGIDADEHGDYYSRWFLYAISRSTGKRVNLPGGANYTVQQGGQSRGITYNGYSFAGRCAGLAVQRNGNFVFVSLPDSNEVIRIDKRTGARASLPFTRPGALLSDREGRLWVASQRATNTDTSLKKLGGVPVGAVSYGDDQQFRVANAFDGNPDTYYASSANVSQGWAGLFFERPVVLSKVRLFPSAGRENDCKGWVQVSNANCNEEARDRRTVLEINSAPATGKFTDYELATTGLWSYFRVWNPAGALKVADIEAWGYDPMYVSVVASYTVTSDGGLAATGVTLTNPTDVTALADDASGNIWSREGGNKQALCRYSKANGGAATLALTSSNGVKFCFNDPYGNYVFNYEQPAPLTCQDDGSVWVGDTNNARLLHLSATGAYIEEIGYIANARNCQGDGNNISRLFDNQREFKVNHAAPLAPDNGSWKLVFNWGQTYNVQVLGKLREIFTLSNNRTYGVVAHEDFPGAPSRHVVELVAGVGVRDTGVLLAQGTQLTENGDVYRFVYDIGVQTKTYRRPLTGFDASGNPTYGQEVLAGIGPTPIATDPRRTHIRRHSSGLTVVYDGLRSGIQYKENGEVLRGEGGGSPFYHLGAWQEGQPEWLWRGARTTDANYSGPMLTNGGFDSGNTVNQADGPLVIMVDKTSKPRRLGVFVYAGEFWKGEQGCYGVVFDLDTGLVVAYFGSDALSNPPQMTSVVVSAVFVRVSEDRARIFVNEEGGRGMGCWELSGLVTAGYIVKPVKPAPVSGPTFAPADASIGRVDLGAMQQTVNITSAAALKTALLANYSNTILMMADGDFATEGFEQKGTWSNVLLTSSGNTRFLATTSSTCILMQGGATRKNIAYRNIKFESTYAGGGNPLLWHNELPLIDGYEVSGCSFRSPNGSANGLGCVQYSTSSKQGQVAKNILIENNTFQDIGRCGIELLSQGYDGVFRLFNLTIRKNTFANLGIQNEYGMAVSLSGLFRQIDVSDNNATGTRRIGYEFVNTQQAIARNNNLSNGKDGVGYGFSDDDKGFTSDVWVYGGDINAAERPFYIYECKAIHLDGQGKLWKGGRGADMGTISGCTFDNLNLLIQSTAKEASWQWGSGCVGNTATNCTISSAGSAAVGRLPAYEPVVLRSGATGNKLLNCTTILGKQANGQTFAPSPETGADGRIVDQGASNTITNNTKSVVA